MCFFYLKSFQIFEVCVSMIQPYFVYYVCIGMNGVQFLLLRYFTEMYLSCFNFFNAEKKCFASYTFLIFAFSVRLNINSHVIELF